MKTEVLILGTGSPGEVLASQITKSRKSVMINEEQPIGGE